MSPASEIYLQYKHISYVSYLRWERPGSTVSWFIVDEFRCLRYQAEIRCNQVDHILMPATKPTKNADEMWLCNTDKGTRSYDPVTLAICNKKTLRNGESCRSIHCADYYSGIIASL